MGGGEDFHLQAPMTLSTKTKGRLSAAQRKLREQIRWEGNSETGVVGANGIPPEHQRTGRVAERVDDVEGRAGPVGLLQRPVAHMQLEPDQNAMISRPVEGGGVRNDVGLRLGALVLREHRERRGREPPLRLRLPGPGLEVERRQTKIVVSGAVGVHHGALNQEVRIDEVAAGTANKPGVDALLVAISDISQGAVVADLSIERELVRIPLRLAAEHGMTLRSGNGKAAAGIARRGKQTKQISLRVTPAPVAADQIAVIGEAAAAGEIIGRAFRLSVHLQD